jgi:hypothetical protein
LRERRFGHGLEAFRDVEQLANRAVGQPSAETLAPFRPARDVIEVVESPSCWRRSAQASGGS